MTSRPKPAISEPAALVKNAPSSQTESGVVTDERARRKVALLAALAPEVLAVGAVSATETTLTVTVLLPFGGEAAVQSALNLLSKERFSGTKIELRGPLPPVSFFAVRVTKIGQGEVSRAWRRLDLPERIDVSSLHWHWRLRAASAHPDRQPPGLATTAGAEVAEITDAYRLLRDLLPRVQTPTDGRTSLAQVLQRAGHRLIVPAIDKGFLNEPLSREAVQ